MHVKPWFSGSNELHLMPTKQTQTITMRQSTTPWRQNTTTPKRGKCTWTTKVPRRNSGPSMLVEIAVFVDNIFF